jgi:hypothetical protein
VCSARWAALRTCSPSTAPALPLQIHSLGCVSVQAVLEQCVRYACAVHAGEHCTRAALELPQHCPLICTGRWMRAGVGCAGAVHTQCVCSACWGAPHTRSPCIAPTYAQLSDASVWAVLEQCTGSTQTRSPCPSSHLSPPQRPAASLPVFFRIGVACNRHSRPHKVREPRACTSQHAANATRPRAMARRRWRAVACVTPRRRTLGSGMPRSHP